MKDISNEKEFFKNSQKFNDFDYIKRLDFFFGTLLPMLLHNIY